MNRARRWYTSWFFLKNGPIPASFCFFPLFSHYNFNNTNWKTRRWCAWDLNPGPQDGRRRWNHGAMAATQWSVWWPFHFNFNGRSEYRSPGKERGNGALLVYQLYIFEQLKLHIYFIRSSPGLDPATGKDFMVNKWGKRGIEKIKIVEIFLYFMY